MFNRSGQTLHLVTVMVRYQHCADAGDAEQRKRVEGAARPEVDEDGASAILDEVDIARIIDAE